MSSSNCCFLTCIQVSLEAGQVVWYAHLFQNSPQFIVIHRVKGCGIVNKAEIDVFLELSCFSDDSLSYYSPFLKFNFIFHWGIIAVQYCDGYCHTSTWIGHRYTSSLPTPSPYFVQRGLALGALWHTANVHWLPVLRVVMCMFQYYSYSSVHYSPLTLLWQKPTSPLLLSYWKDLLTWLSRSSIVHSNPPHSPIWFPKEQFWPWKFLMAPLKLLLSSLNSLAGPCHSFRALLGRWEYHINYIHLSYLLQLFLCSLNQAALHQSHYWDNESSVSDK